MTLIKPLVAIASAIHFYESNGSCWWWTRTMNAEAQSVVNVRSDGRLKYVDTPVDATGYGVRPAMWVSMK